MTLSENSTTSISKSLVINNLLVFPVSAAYLCPWDNQVLIFIPLYSPPAQTDFFCYRRGTFSRCSLLWQGETVAGCCYCNLCERGFCGGVDVFATPADGKEVVFTEHFKLHNGSWKPKEGEEGSALEGYMMSAKCHAVERCQLSRSLRSACGTHTASAGCSPHPMVLQLWDWVHWTTHCDNPSPAVTGGAEKRSIPSLPELGQKWIEEMRLLSFPLYAGSEIAVLFYILSGRELWLISKHTPRSGRNRVLPWQLFCLNSFLFTWRVWTLYEQSDVSPSA